MDAFTEKILARARERQKLLADYTGSEKTPLGETNSNNSSKINLADIPKLHKESVSDSNLTSNSNDAASCLKENKSDSNLPRFSRQNSKTRVSSQIPGSPGSQLKTLNIQQENFNMEIRLTSTENVRVEVEIAEADGNSDSENNHDENGLRDESKSKLKRLGRLYAGGEEADISSPIHKTEAKFCTDESSHSGDSKTKSEKHAKCSKKGLSKLADLAHTINQWEDDVSTPRSTEEKKVTSPKKTWKPPAPQPPVTASPVKPASTRAAQKPRAPDPPSSQAGSSGKANLPGSPTKKLVPPKEDGGTQEVDAVPKKLKWDKNVLDSLESQGYTRTNSKSRLVYAYDPQDPPSDTKIKQIRTALESKTSDKDEPIAGTAKPQMKTGNVADRKAVFESGKAPKDPALLSVSERKALFEKNQGMALVPRAAFGMAPATKTSSTKMISDKVETWGTTSSGMMSKKVETSSSSGMSTKVETSSSNSSGMVSKKSSSALREGAAVAVVQQAGGIASKVAALMEGKSTISQEQIESGVKSERQKEMDMLLNRFNKSKAVVSEAILEESDDEEEEYEEADEKTAMINGSAAQIISAGNKRKSAEKRRSSGKPQSKGDSPQVTSVLNEVKRIRVSAPKPGGLYPNLSDIEATTETETDNPRSPTPEESQSSSEDNNESDDPNTSFGRDILEAVCKNQTPHKRPIYDESTASDVSSILDDMDNYLGEYSNGETSSTGPTPPKQVKPLAGEKTVAHPSNSFHYKTFSPAINSDAKKFQSPMKTTRISIESVPGLPEYVVEGDNLLHLTHTVSFYRKQQSQAQTPVRQISRQPQIEATAEENTTDEESLVSKKMDQLKEEVNKQQNIISQTSQALNLCSCTPEFSGSTEQVEAERVLLVATHRRQAALHEIQRLKVEGTIRPQGHHSKNLPLEKGTLTISHIVLPLKQKYVKALAAAGGKGHHVVCLVKCGEQVVPTKLVSTVIHNAKNPDAELAIPGTVVLKDIYSDFTVTFEVYCLQAQEEFLPHEVKYHINKKFGGKLVTPKKSKQDSRMIMPVKESPGGPQAVRTSSFAVMGYVVFSVQAVNKRTWSLNNTPSMSPLEGTAEMRIRCELAVSVEHRGFLTMFQDVSGFGAWHRRWCLLKGDALCYWKYPDDEKKMAPIDTINLKSCVTQRVEPVSREICARLHTFLIERERAAHPQDKDSLVTVCKGDKTVIRHLLSADTKEERIEWCEKFNSALTALRMWGSSQ